MSLVFTVLIAILGTLYYGCKIVGGKAADKAWKKNEQERFAQHDKFMSMVRDDKLEEELEKRWNSSEEFREEAIRMVNDVIDSIPETAGFRLNYKKHKGILLTKKQQNEASYCNFRFILTILMAKHGKLPSSELFGLHVCPLYGEWPDESDGTNDKNIRIALVRWIVNELRNNGVNVRMAINQNGTPGVNEFEWEHLCSAEASYTLV